MRDEDYMRHAIDLARQAAGSDEVPVGALVVKDGEIVESGISDQILDDPQEPFTQLLVSSILKP